MQKLFIVRITACNLDIGIGNYNNARNLVYLATFFCMLALILAFGSVSSSSNSSSFSLLNNAVADKDSGGRGGGGGTSGGDGDGDGGGDSGGGPGKKHKSKKEDGGGEGDSSPSSSDSGKKGNNSKKGDGDGGNTKEGGGDSSSKHGDNKKGSSDNNDGFPSATDKGGSNSRGGGSNNPEQQQSSALQTPTPALAAPQPTTTGVTPSGGDEKGCPTGTYRAEHTGFKCVPLSDQQQPQQKQQQQQLAAAPQTSPQNNGPIQNTLSVPFSQSGAADSSKTGPSTDQQSQQKQQQQKSSTNTARAPTICRVSYSPYEKDYTILFAKSEDSTTLEHSLIYTTIQSPLPLTRGLEQSVGPHVQFVGDPFVDFDICNVKDSVDPKTKTSTKETEYKDGHKTIEKSNGAGTFSVDTYDKNGMLTSSKLSGSNFNDPNNVNAAVSVSKDGKKDITIAEGDKPVTKFTMTESGYIKPSDSFKADPVPEYNKKGQIESRTITDKNGITVKVVNVETLGKGNKGLIGYKAIDAKKPDGTTIIDTNMAPEGRLFPK